MTSIAKLKDRARKYEQKEDWKAAIEAYQQVLEAEQGEDELELELGLFNRIGDLYLRLGQTDEAVSYYEEAADKYAEAGFFNNAIALCNKALRHRPERPQIYLKLSRLSAEQGFVTDARRWILDYAERQVKAGRVDAALDGLGDFVATSDDPDVREFLAQQLATHGREQEAAQQYAIAYGERMRRGESEAAERVAARARSIDPNVDLAAAAPAAAPDAEELAVEDDGGLAIEPTGLDGLETRQDAGLETDVVGLEGLESTGGASEGLEIDAGEEMAGLEVSYTERGPEVAPDEVEDAGSLGGLETFGTLAIEDGGDTADEEEDALGAEPLPLMDDGEAEPLPLLDEDFGAEDDEPEEDADPLPMMDFGDETDLAAGADAATEDEAPPEIGGDEDGLDLGALDLGMGETAETEEAAETEEVAEVAEPEPDELDLDAIIRRSQEQVSRGLTGEAMRELALLSGIEAPAPVIRKALAVVNEIIRREPDDLAALQRRVEFASRAEDRALMIEAYMELARALSRAGAETKAHAMYERVLDLDAGNAAAMEALGTDAGPADEETVDLDAILREMDPDEVGGAGPVPDEGSDPAFAAMLSQFKAKVTEQGDSEDAGDHYDLGLAFKEMGLIDEAIAEFQTALTGGEERLKVYEELGQCFVLKGQFNVALKIFNRALQVPHPDPADLLGVYYHLGQCHEELGQRDRARQAYEKVLAIDPTFQDVPDRMARL